MCLRYAAVLTDLGVGCGILSIATALLGAAHNVGFDVDDLATRIARHNFAQLDCHVDLVHVDVRAMRYQQADDEREEAAMEQAEERGSTKASGRSTRERGGRGRGRGGRVRSTARHVSRSNARGRSSTQHAGDGQLEQLESSEEDIEDDNSDQVSHDRVTPTALSSPSPPRPLFSSLSSFPPCVLDTVVLNPPFGTRQSGVDVTFLHVALQLARTAVYSLHKSSTRPFLVRLCERWGVAGEVIAAMRFDLKRSYAFHREAVREVEVDLWRFTFVDAFKPQRFCAPQAIHTAVR